MGGAKTKTAQTTKSEIPAEIRERGTAISTGAMNQYFDPAEKYKAFNFNDYSDVGKSTTGQLNNYHSQAGNQFTNANNSYQPYINRADQAATNANANNQATGVNGPDYSFQNIQGFMNPFQQGVIDQGVREIGRGLNDARLNNQSRAAQAGAFGGARHGVVDAESQRTAANSLNDFVGTQLNQGFNQAVGQYNTNFGQGLQANAANNAAKAQNFGQAQSLSQILANLGQQRQSQDIAGGNASMNFGNIVMQQEQAEKDNAYNKGYIDKRDYPLEIYERLAGINAMQPVNRTSTSTGTSKESGGWLGPALGAVGSIVSMASDERVKEDIETIDPETVLGAFASVTPKSYKYKDDILASHPDLTKPGRRTGFMAQDLERAFQKEAGLTVDGIKTVDIPELMGNLVAAVTGLERRTRGLAVKKRAAT